MPSQSEAGEESFAVFDLDFQAFVYGFERFDFLFQKIQLRRQSGILEPEEIHIDLDGKELILKKKSKTYFIHIRAFQLENRIKPLGDTFGRLAVGVGHLKFCL